MAITQNTYTGNGSTVDYSFTFPYLETTDVKVTINGTPTTAYTFANATMIQFNTAPANGAAIRIYRDTDDASLAATFYSGSAIRAQDLNDNFTQNLYVTQEVNNNAVSIDGSNPMVGNLNMNGFQIDNLAAPTSANDAANKAYVDALAVSGGDGDKGDITVSGLGSVFTIDNGAITNAKVNASAGIVSSKLAFTQAGTGAVARTVESKLQDVVSVLDFIPDSEHAAIKAGTSTYNATAAIQAALNAGGKVYLPKGTYLVTNTLQLTTTAIVGKRPEILGDGGNTSTTIIDFQPATPGIPLINHFHTGRYEGVYFKGPGASTGAGEVAFNFGNVGTQRHTIIQDCMFRYWDKAALYFSGQWNITVDNCRFLDCGNSVSPVALTGGVVFDQTVVTGWSTSGMIFSNCYFSGCSYGYYAEAAWNLTFINPIFEYCAYPYWRNASGSAHVLIDPWYESNANDPVSTGPMVVLGGRGVGWTGNNVSTSSESGSIHIASGGIQVYKTSTPRINIKGNGYIAFEDGYGIDFSATAGAGASNSILSDYEQGTWTPAVTDGTNSASITTTIATYTKIGNIVNIRAAILNINTAGLTAGNQIRITGLPYATASTANTWQNFPITVADISSTGGTIVGQLRNSSTQLLLNNQTTTGLSSAVVSQITSGAGDIWLNFSYFT